MLETPISLVSTSVSTKVQGLRRHLRAVRRAGAKRAGHPCNEGSLLVELAKVFKLNFLLGYLGMQLVKTDEEPLASSPQKAAGGQVVEEIDEDSEVDPDYVLSSEESEDSLEYRYGYLVLSIN